MNPKLYRFVQLLLGSILFWILAFLLLTTFRYYGLSMELTTYNEYEFALPIRAFYAYSFFLGFTIGVFYAIIEFAFDIYLSKKIILGLDLLLKFIVYVALLIIILSFISFSFEAQVGIDLDNERGWWRTDPTFWSTVLYFAIASIVFSLIRVANNKFGRGVLLNMLFGKYRNPQEEERVLMFIDLKDSTQIAENLGHVKYSKFIQDCFVILNSVLTRYEAEVYQYVGDEAVINWNKKRGFSKNNCIDLFFDFKNKLEQNATYFKKEFDHIPTFKAGIHFGIVMVAEVGSTKKELAFHGDVINTASRIQGLCNRFNAMLLISDSVFDQINKTPYHIYEIAEAFELKGKQDLHKVFKVKKK
ncbi:MAG: adenylate/guanylate cyclase domain-containing protein [Psychroserpens sp.]|nr:adenylate/guanylate cyclase domain-containing protein [Psychroserpens sp.]